MSDLIDRQAAIDTLDKHLRTTDVPVSYPGIISALTEWLNELPSAQADSKETSSTHKALDTISRQAALNALSRGSGCGASCHRAIKALPSAQPETHEERTETHSCDCIERQAAIDMAKDWYDGLICGSFRGLEKRLNSLPSAQPEIIWCKACRWRDDYGHWLGCPVLNTDDDNFCSMAERRTDDC